MDQQIETIDIDGQQSHELLFKIKVEGIEQAPTKVRLVCEDGDVSYMFIGVATHHDGIVQFMLPALQGKLTEGLHASKIEVLIDNRYFAPVQFNINLKKKATVVAETVHVVKKTPVKVEAIAQAVISTSGVMQEKSVLANKIAVPVKINSKIPSRSSTLSEHYETKNVDDNDLDLIRELVRTFVKNKRH